MFPGRAFSNQTTIPQTIAIDHLQKVSSLQLIVPLLWSQYSTSIQKTLSTNANDNNEFLHHDICMMVLFKLIAVTGILDDAKAGTCSFYVHKEALEQSEEGLTLSS
jgi:hypothetical protein